MKTIGIVLLAIVGFAFFSTPLFLFVLLCLLALVVFGVGTVLFLLRKEENHVGEHS